MKKKKPFWCLLLLLWLLLSAAWCISDLMQFLLILTSWKASGQRLASGKMGKSQRLDIAQRSVVVPLRTVLLMLGSIMYICLSFVCFLVLKPFWGKHCFAQKCVLMPFTASRWLMCVWLMLGRTHSDVGLNFLAGEPSHLTRCQVSSLSGTHNNKSHSRTGRSKAAQLLQHMSESADRLSRKVTNSFLKQNDPDAADFDLRKSTLYYYAHEDSLWVKASCKYCVTDCRRSATKTSHYLQFPKTHLRHQVNSWKKWSWLYHSYMGSNPDEALMNFLNKNFSNKSHSNEKKRRRAAAALGTREEVRARDEMQKGKKKT